MTQLGLFDKLKNDLVITVATAVLNTDKETWDINTMQEWRKGWLEGYTQCYKQLTGETIYRFVDKVNDMLAGSGHEIKL